THLIHAFVPSLYFYHTATNEIHPLSLHDALPILKELSLLRLKVCEDCYNKYEINKLPLVSLSDVLNDPDAVSDEDFELAHNKYRSEEHTSELQSRENLVCRLLLEQKKPS